MRSWVLIHFIFCELNLLTGISAVPKDDYRYKNCYFVAQVLPVVEAFTGDFICGAFFTPRSNPCNETKIMNQDATVDYLDEPVCVSTLVVKPGCFFEGFTGTTYTGSRAGRPSGFHKYGFNECFRSYRCICPGLYSVNCTVTGSYEQIQVFNLTNYDKKKSFPCNVKYSVGLILDDTYVEYLKRTPPAAAQAMMEKVVETIKTGMRRWAVKMTGMAKREITKFKEFYKRHMCPGGSTTIFNQLQFSCGGSKFFTSTLQAITQY